MRLVVVESVVLMGWWLYQAQGDSAAETWTLFSSYNIGSVLIQWAVVLAAFMLLNRFLVRHLVLSEEGGGDPSGDVPVPEQLG